MGRDDVTGDLFREDRARRRRGLSGQDAESMFDALHLLLGDLITAVENIGGKSQQLLNSDQPGAATWSLTTGGATPGNALPNATKCRWQFEKATAFTVQFAIDTLGANPQATVTWYRGGQQITREIDVAAGTSISGFGESVSVVVADQTNVNLIPGSFSYNVTATISPGTRPPGSNPPIFTAFYGQNLVAGATTSNLTIPFGATGVRVYGVSGGQTAQLSIAVGGTQAAMGPGLPEMGGFIPISSYATGVTVTNQGSGTAHGVTVVFAIDG